MTTPATPTDRDRWKAQETLGRLDRLMKEGRGERCGKAISRVRVGT